MAAPPFGSRYEVLRLIGGGGMGKVFLVRDLAADRLCALKRLRPEMRARRSDLRREFETLSRLRHPSIVEVYECSLAPNGTPFYTMEYVPGRPMDQAIQLGDWPQLLWAAAEVAHGLDVLHGQGIIHGDLKPTNLLAVSSEDGQGAIRSVRLVDFGLATVLGGRPRSRQGTSGFAAPEVLRGDPPSVASDLYGLGATLFTLACGQLPFRGESPDAILRQQLSGSPDRGPLENRGASPSLVELVLQLLAADPRARPRSAREVRLEVESIAPSIRRSVADRLGSATLVGREAELATIEARLGQSRRGSRLLVVVGPSGIGKSAFLAEVATRASRASHSVMRLCGSSHGVMEFADSLAAGRSPESAGGGRLARVCVIDNADELNPTSRHVLRQSVLSSDESTLWVIAHSDGEIPEEEQLLIDSGLADLIKLGPISKESIADLAATRLRDPCPARLAGFLWDYSHGNPGLAMEALLLAASAGLVRESAAGLAVDWAGLANLEIGDSLASARRERVRRLPVQARRAVEILAVLGPTPMGRLIELAPDIDWDISGMLINQGLVRQDNTGLALEWAVKPEVLSPEEVRALHRAALNTHGLSPADRFRHLVGAGEAALALQSAHDSWEQEPDPSLLRSAAELAEPDDPATAAAWRERMTRGFFMAGQYASAIPELLRALELDRDPDRRLSRQYLLSSAYLRLGEMERTGDVIREALANDPPPGLRARLLTNSSSRFHSLGQLVQAEAMGRDALKLAEQAGDLEAEGAAAQSLAYIMLASGRTAEASAFADTAARAATNHGGTPFGRARAEGTLAAVAHAEHQHTKALANYRSALDFARAHGLRTVVEELLLSQSVVQCEAGLWTHSRQSNAEALRLALEDHRPRNAAVAMANLALTDALIGQPRRARREARAAIRLARRYQPTLEAIAWRALAYAERTAGRQAEAERAARRALDVSVERGSVEEIGWSRLEYGKLCAQRGRWGEAQAAWLAALDDLSAKESVLVCLLTIHAAEAALALGDAQLTRDRLANAETLRERGAPSPLTKAGCLRCKAALEISEGRIDEGLALGQQALQVWRAAPAPAEMVQTALSLAQAALEKAGHSPDVIREWLDEAAATCDRLGDHRGRQRALQLIVQWHERRPQSNREGPSTGALLERVGEILSSLSDLPELAERALQLVVEQLSAERGLFLVMDPASGCLTPLAQHGLSGKDRRHAVDYSRGVVAKVATSGDSLLVVDAPRDPQAMFESVRRLNLRSILCVPLRAGDRIMGALYLDDSRRTCAFQESHRDLLEGITSLLSTAISRSLGEQEMARTNEELLGENRTLRKQIATRFRTQELIGSSSAMLAILPLIERAAETNASVLLIGESGTGKELIARIIHSNSKRKNRAFVPVNCGAIPDTLVESELFGIKPNIATGVHGRVGMFRQADGGTLFLDEIGDMPIRQQVTLFSALGNHEVSPVGGEGRSFPVDVRVIAATNRDLAQMVDERTFREELYYRLNVFPIEVPPLRDRRPDIPALAQHFVRTFAKLQEREVPGISQEFLNVLMQSQWPGNVRQFQNYIERVMAMTPGSLLRPLRDSAKPVPGKQAGSLASGVRNLELQRLTDALKLHGGNQSRAAQELGLSEAGIRRLMAKHGVTGSRTKRRSDPKRRMRT